MFTVREIGKTGGCKYLSLAEAVSAAIGWMRETGISCEIIGPYGAIILADAVVRNEFRRK